MSRWKGEGKGQVSEGEAGVIYVRLEGWKEY